MNKFTYTMFISFITNTVLSAVKIIIGLIGNSISFIADGIHTFADMSTDLVSITEDSIKGDTTLKRFVNLVTGFVILGLGFVTIYLSVTKDVKTPSLYLLIILPILIIIKYILSTYVLEKGILYNNTILIRNSHENDVDIISSVIVLIGLIIIQLKGVIPYLEYTDMVVGIIVSLFIIKSGFDVLSHEISDIMSKPYINEELKDSIKDVVTRDKNVLSLNNIDILKYGPYYELKIEIVLNESTSLKKANQVARNLEKKIKMYHPEIEYITIKVNNEIYD